jgi:hypothetical protein
MDGNWDAKVLSLANGQAALVHPSVFARRGFERYKNQFINLEAKTAWVRQVIFRNYGAVGYLPHSRYDDSAAETFPLKLNIFDSGQEPEPGTRRPVVVEDCEFHGMRSAYLGYGTMMMVNGWYAPGNTPAWATNDPARRLVQVQRVQIRDRPLTYATIGWGSAASASDGSSSSPGFGTGTVTFADNAVLNAWGAFNTDTALSGAIRRFDTTNCLALNVWQLGNAPYPSQVLMREYQVSGNTIRLGPRYEYPVYTDWYWPANSSGGPKVSDPSLALGRPEKWWASGLRLSALSNSAFSYNWITTVPLAQFYAPNPGQMDKSIFQPVLKLWQDGTNAPNGGFFRYQAHPSSLDFTAISNRVSNVAFDFGSFEVIPGGFWAGYTPSSSPALQTNRYARTNTYLATFMPTGTVERLHLVYTNQARTWSWRYGTGGGGFATDTLTTQEPTLVGGFEVTCGVPTWTGDQTSVQVPVRLAFQPTPGSGHAGTWYGAGSNLWLEVGGALSQTNFLAANSNGLATFNLSVGALQCGVLNLRAYFDPRAATGAAGKFDEYQVAYATATVPLCPTVWLEAQPDVANDKSLHRGRLRFRRVPGRDGVLSALTVGFRLPLVPALTNDYRALYTTDYTLVATNGATLSLHGDKHQGLHTVTFPSNSPVAEVDVVPVYDDLTEDELVWAVLEPSANYAVGSPAEAQVYIYDGPLWTLRILGDAFPNDGGATRVWALNNDFNTNTFAPTAKLAGEVEVTRYGTTDYAGAAWRVPAYGSVFWYYNPYGFQPVPYDVANSVNGTARYAGGFKQGNGTWRALRSSEQSWTYLSVSNNWLATNSLARGISPDGRWLAGYATLVNPTNATIKQMRAVRWDADDSFSFTNLIEGGITDPNLLSRAHAVNNFGEFAGSLTKVIPNGYRQRGFRTRPGGVLIEDMDHLPPLGGENNALATEALAIRKADSGTVGGLAVGWSDYVENSVLRRISTYWTSRSTSIANGFAVRIGASIENNIPHVATAVNDADDVVGWMKPPGFSPIAYYRDRNDKIYELNDGTVLHRLPGGAGAQLETPTDISNSGHITVNGSLNGIPKAFLLIRR